MDSGGNNRDEEVEVTQVASATVAPHQQRQRADAGDRHRRTGQPVDDNDDHEEGKDACANWCNEDASDNNDEMAPHFRFEQL